MHRLQPYGKALVAFFFAALILIGLATAMDYGVNWDELGEIGILRMALMEYARLIPLDTPYKQSLEAMQVTPISQSIERDHGICLYYPVFWAVCRTDWTPAQVARIWRAQTWLIFMAGAYSLYAIGRRMGLSRGMACLGVMMLVLTPRIFADAHYNNKDIALMSMVLFTLWQTLRLAEKPTARRGLTFALAAGLCAGTRVIGVAVCGLCGLGILCQLGLRRLLNRRTVGVGLFAAAMSVLFYALLTPAFLSDPVGFPIYLLKNAVGFSRWHGTILYLGNLIPTASQRLPFHYLPVMIGITTPIWALALLLFGQAHAAWAAMKGKLSLRQSEGLAVILASLLWLMPLLASAGLRVLVYNGWRHLYFIYGPMVLLMLYGWSQLWQWLKGHIALRRIAAGALALCLGVATFGIVANHPYQYGYYNALVPKDGLETRFELDYWNVSCLNALSQLLSTVGPQETVHVAASDIGTRSGLSMAITYLKDDRLVAVPYDPAHLDSFYTLSNLTYANINGFQPPAALRPVITLRSYGVPMTIVYACEKP